MANFNEMIVLALLIGACTCRGEGAGEKTAQPSWVDQQSMERKIAKPLHHRLVLSCKAVGYPEPDIQWMKDGIKIGSDESKKQDSFNYYKVNKRKQSLVIMQLLKVHEGSYTCIISNPYGTINHTYIVEGLEYNIYGPKIIEKPNNQTIIVGMDAYFRCGVDGGGLATVIKWVYAQNVNYLDKSGKDSFTIISGYKNKNELIIHNASKKDSRWYTCFVQNSAGRAVEKAHLMVLAVMDTAEQPPENITASTTRTLLDIWSKIKLCVFSYLLI